MDENQRSRRYPGGRIAKACATQAPARLFSLLLGDVHDLGRHALIFKCTEHTLGGVSLCLSVLRLCPNSVQISLQLRMEGP